MTGVLRAAYVLNAGKRIAILVGLGALKATDELEVLAETLGAPIIKALLGKAAVPREDHRDGGGGSYSRTGLASVVGTVGATALNRTSGNSGKFGV